MSGAVNMMVVSKFDAVASGKVTKSESLFVEI
jgi:hypothetical protein